MVSIRIQAGGKNWDGPLDFEASNEDFDHLLSILDDSTSDTFPNKWEPLGTMFIGLKNGKRIQLDLYATGEEKGAYSWQRPNGRDYYYRGSSDSEIIAAINRAYENTKRGKDSE